MRELRTASFKKAVNPGAKVMLWSVLAFLRRLFFQSPWFCSLVRVLLGGVFAIAGGAKLAAPRAFARIISAYGFVPEEFLVPLAIGLPAI